MTARRTGRARRTALVPAIALVAAGALLTVGTVSTAQAAQHRPGAPAAVQPLQAEPTAEEQERLREIAGAIWTPQLAAGWNMNAEVANVLSEATERILTCSEAFALVPRPAPWMPGLSYLVKYWKNLKDYFLVVKDNRTYRACVVSTAAYYRSIIEMASAGI
ncbi:hypothetical protein [Streptomyces clavuligerus]|uniref:hypothetical protein n=1 Tax=Streptomyces clavuligerus TaxID=1901 RepID=UPI0001851C20|nr:hypothetical protein [Streptomyces clavuligerus]ANW21676.1 hypothetical protein BB341_27415 [Streptomyces clavuligerus]AXU16304.1 hypothetical protein D1794_28485 [Streptomyces clavuligerus]MBY6306465.1 hypothetical protein [Streptomyces clavuligerus]QCS09084.1 hypothetical protein CRV15_27845 [Streptomyces clavuligerus]QPJ91582.1 hypothetical protein GE265_00325 [Streptomyces clavuligerus]